MNLDLNLAHKRAAATVTAVPSSSLVNQSYGVSVQNILFGALTILLAVASLLLTYLQLLHMRKQTGSRRSDVEMLEPSKSLPYRNKYPISSWPYHKVNHTGMTRTSPWPPLLLTSSYLRMTSLIPILWLLPNPTMMSWWMKLGIMDIPGQHVADGYRWRYMFCTCNLTGSIEFWLSILFYGTYWWAKEHVLSSVKLVVVMDSMMVNLSFNHL